MSYMDIVDFISQGNSVRFAAVTDVLSSIVLEFETGTLYSKKYAYGLCFAVFEVVCHGSISSLYATNISSAVANLCDFPVLWDTL